MESFPWTEEQVDDLLRGFSGNTPFSVKWPWASFHSPGFRALRWAAYNNLTVPEVYKIFDDLSAPAAPKKHLKKLSKAGALDIDNRIVPLDPALTMKKTFKMAHEKIETFKRKDLVLMTVDDLLHREPHLTQIWKPIFEEDSTYIQKWFAYDPLLLKTFQSLGSWEALKLVECLVGVAKPLSVLNFERIY